VTLASIADAVITTDREQRVSFCNRNAEQMLGLPGSVLLGRPLAEVCQLEGEPGALHVVAANGVRVAVERSVAPIHAPDGTAIGQVIVLHDASEARRHAAQLTYQATHDELTDILNRREFERRLCELLAALRQGQGGEHAVLYLDLDRFKIINDTSGHAAGDELIRQVSQLLQATLRERDIVGRLGGDEFGIMLNQCSHGDALRVAEKVRKSIVDLRFAWGVRSYRIGVSIGVVLLDGRSTSLKEVMKSADAACYMAKEKGRNRIHLFSEDDAELSVRQTEMEAVSRIRAALESDRFCLHLQTIAPLRAGGRTHAEVLLRMIDEQGGLVPPMAFIPAAERYDLMPLLDRWVIRNAFAALAQQPPGTSWAINLSGASVCEEGLLDYVLEQQRASGVALEDVCFEITETAAVANLAQAATLIQDLQAQGARFALDDFGAGMSSFAYLKHLPVDYVKIDGSFIRGILHSPTERAMVESINQIAHVMGKQTIAEFVEDDGHRLCPGLRHRQAAALAILAISPGGE
jgi:diguanylate cyclase (GGDEF)-like protein